MTVDRRPEDRRHPRQSPPDARLAAWFAAEVRRAEADLAGTAGRRERPSGGRRRGLPRSPRLLALGVLAVAAAVAALQLPRLGPSAVGEPPGLGPPLAGSPGAAASPRTPGPSPSPIEERYPDGIPSSLNGEAVFRPLDVAAGRTGSEATSYLLGGWSTPGRFARSCPVVPAGNAASVLIPPCGGWRIGETPLVPEPALGSSVGVVIEDVSGPMPRGPVVLRVHTDDPRAASCPAAMRARCQAAIVVDEVVWVGQEDPVAATAPLRADQVADALRTVFSDLEFRSRRTRCPEGEFCALDPSMVAFGNACNPGWPTQSWLANEAQLGRILVFPSVAARRGTEGNLTRRGWVGTDATGSRCSVLFDADAASAWVAVENVIVEVRVAASGPTPEQQARIEAIHAALEAAQ